MLCGLDLECYIKAHVLNALSSLAVFEGSENLYDLEPNLRFYVIVDIVPNGIMEC